MTEQESDGAVKRNARIAGALYVIVIITAGFAEGFARGKLVVPRNPATTASNIISHEALWRLGGAADMLNLVCDVPLTILLYYLLKPVSKTVSLISATFELMGDAMLAVTTITHFTVLVLLVDASYFTGFNTEQLLSQALELARIHTQGYNVAMVFYGFRHILLGYLVFRSLYIARAIGPLLTIAGACYVVNAFSRFLAPALARHLFPYILWPGLLAEAALALWLLIVGVNGQRWRERAVV
jgi:hypothetical protein